MIDLAVIHGDGIGREVVPAAIHVLEAVADDISITNFELGADHWLSTGVALPDEILDELAQKDAILLGAVGSPKVPPGLLERELLLKLRFSFDYDVNLRPARLYKGAAQVDRYREDIDLVVVREGTEGAYSGNGGNLRRSTEHEIATEVGIHTRFGVERVIRAAFEQAMQRKAKHVTLVHKTNVMIYAGSLWDRVFKLVAAEYPEVDTAYHHIDAAMIHLVEDPGRFDVIVTDNLFGDIISDLAGSVSGGIGLAASANINSSGEYPSMFEPVHGSAPDIAGQDIANPIATILSVSMMLQHLGRVHEASQIEKAVSSYMSATDLTERVSTIDVAYKIIELLDKTRAD
jgi:3-isopropylmalate dehydrogenase